jgi:hypothetical protein
MMTNDFKIRSCTLDDESDAIMVCLYTGDSGNDASSQYNDRNILGYRYVSPYIHFSSELAFVLVDSYGAVCGYVLAVLQSRTFYQRYVDEWLPKMKEFYPRISSGIQSDDSELEKDDQ